MKKKILIVGASGYVGSFIYNKLNNNENFDLYGTFCKNKKRGLIKFDYTQNDNFDEIFNFYPDVIIWAAGEKNLKKTEESLSYSEEENLKPLKRFFQSANLNRNFKFIYFSTDYVFDGTTGNYSIYDIPRPISNYGISKLDSENFLIQQDINLHIIRAGAIIGEDSVFFQWLINAIKKSDKLTLYDNYFTPTPIINLINLINDLLSGKVQDKLIHVTGDEKLTRFELGEIILQTIGSRSILIKESYLNAELKFFKDLSLLSSYNSKNNLKTSDFITKLIA